MSRRAARPKPRSRGTGRPEAWRPKRPRREIVKAVVAGGTVVLVTVAAVWLLAPDTGGPTVNPAPTLTTPPATSPAAPTGSTGPPANETPNTAPTTPTSQPETPPAT